MSQTTCTLNEKLNRHYTLQTIKDNLREIQNRVLDKLHDNIIVQNGEDSIFSILNVFDLTSRESLGDKLQKNSQLFRIFGEDTTHDVEEWFGFKVRKITMLRARALESVQYRLGNDRQPRKRATRSTNENRCHEAKTYATQTTVEIFERYGCAMPRLV